MLDLSAKIPSTLPEYAEGLQQICSCDRETLVHHYPLQHRCQGFYVTFLQISWDVFDTVLSTVCFILGKDQPALHF